jgi:hypothetical protein
MSNIPAYINQDRAQSLMAKWSPMLNFKSKDINPIEDSRVRLNTAILLENQERWCLQEAGNTAGSGGVFGTHQGTAGAFSGDRYAAGDSRLPKVLIPMIRRTFPELITNEIVGVQPMSGPVGLAFALRYRYEADPLGATRTDNLYGNVGANTIPGNRVPADGKEVGYNYLNTTFTGTSAGALSGLPGEFDFDASDAGVAALLSSFELSSNIPQMTVEFEKTAVEAGTRRLAARWSLELEQDIKNMNGIDIDNELTNAMSYEIQAEIDREMVMRMAQVALNAGRGPGYSFWYAASADARWMGERTRDFYAKIIVESNRMAVRNRRGAANFIIATPRVCAMLQQLPEFQIMPVQSTVNTQPTGIAKVGSVGGQFQVYRDTRTEAQYQSSARSQPLEYALLGTRVQSSTIPVSSTAHTSQCWCSARSLQTTSAHALV